MTSLMLALVALGLSAKGHLPTTYCASISGFPPTPDIVVPGKTVPAASNGELNQVREFMLATNCSLWIVGLHAPSASEDERKMARDRAEAVRAYLTKQGPGGRRVNETHILTKIMTPADNAYTPQNAVRFYR